MIFLLVALMLACNSEDVGMDNNQELKTKSSSETISPITQLSDIPCNLLLQETGDPMFLSARPSNWELRLHGLDDGSLRQRWYLRQVNSNSGYNIVLQGGSDRSNNRPIFIN